MSEYQSERSAASGYLCVMPPKDHWLKTAFAFCWFGVIGLACAVFGWPLLVIDWFAARKSEQCSECFGTGWIKKPHPINGAICWKCHGK
jgi:hypothetical protein